MKQYVDLLNKILTTGEKREDRTGVGTLSIFGGQLEFDLRECFPVVTIKETRWRVAFLEMLWFIRGESNTKFLKEHNCNLWDNWADKDGDVGPIYGVQWRHWPGKNLGEGVIPSHTRDIDQIKELLRGMILNPNGRRHIVTAWNPTYLKEMGLPPCHRDFHCYVSNEGHLDLMMAIRSWDTLLGGPFNIAQYALLTHLIARATDLKPRRLIINYGDAHIYLNHVEPVKKLLAEKQPKECIPLLVFKTNNIDIDGYKLEDFEIEGYESHPFLKLPIAV